MQPREDLESLVTRVGSSRLLEGTTDFDLYRQNLLRDTERLYYLSLTTYRRAHNLMAAASAFWAYVTLYYSSWYAAHALIGCFGGWVGKKKFVEVVHDAPGSQCVRSANRPKDQGGPHQSFWRIFYPAVKPLKSIVDTEFLPALDPVSSNPTWQIDTRNRVNYEVEGATKLRVAHESSFDPARFPSSLSGDLATQYEITRCMVGAAAQFLVEMAVATDEFVSRETSLKDDVWNLLVPDVVVTSDARFIV